MKTQTTAWELQNSLCYCWTWVYSKTSPSASARPSCWEQIQLEMPLALKNCSCVISSYSFIRCWRHRTKTLIDIYFENFWTKQEFRELFWFSNYLTKPYNHHCHWIRWSWRPYADSSSWCRTITLFENIKKIKHERQTAVKMFRHFCWLYSVSLHLYITQTSYV